MQSVAQVARMLCPLTPRVRGGPEPAHLPRTQGGAGPPCGPRGLGFLSCWRNQASPTVYLAGMRTRFPKPLSLVLAALLVAGCRGELPYQGMLAADLYALAVTSFDEGEYGEAQLALDRLFILFPSYERAPEAQLLLAESYFRREQFVTASAEYGYFR
ncbi:MAG TPA: hypothetical protein DIU18_06020, partial [Gemmatimonadetes bacterium]|nr:hypothetical protein [Gemmatimonadota bacterium]